MRRTWLWFAIALLVSGTLAAQQPPPPLPPEVGNAVLLGTHSVQVDRDVIVQRGDLVVNDAGAAPFLGELELSIDQGVHTPAGFSLKANAVDIDGGAIVGGDVHFNILQNAGTIQGAQITPLALPVIGMLPGLPDRPAGTEDIIVAEGTVRVVGRGDYAALVIGKNATLRLPGGPYTFTSINAERGATIVWDGPGDVIVKGRMSLAADVTITMAPNITTKRRMFFVRGINGADGLMTSTPPAVSIGKNNDIAATILASNGSVIAGEGLELLGSIVARDIRVGRASQLVLRSGFRNLPPVAIEQNVRTNGSDPVTITLSGFDPDNDPLTFSIQLQPQFGTLGPITQTGPTTAVVTYTPQTEEEEEEGPDDAFIFRVTDSEGFFDDGAITINEGQAPGPPTTITAFDGQAEVPPDRPTIITLTTTAPPGVQVTVSIVEGPQYGSLGPLNQPTQMPPRSASVVYVPPQGFLGEDSFRWQACGVINGQQVCDQAVTQIVVEGPEPPPELAPNLTATANGTTPLPITLGNGSTPPSGPGESFLLPAAAAGQVADANGDGFGDSAAARPTVAAGLGQPQGTVRIEMEFDVSNFGEVAGELQSATVLLRTNKGASDTLATTWYAVGSSADGVLSASDFQQSAEAVAIMSVPLNQPVGADGSYTFDILAELQAALQAGFTHFAIQGRVNENVEELEGPENGLHVYTNDPSNPPPSRPQLALATAGEQTSRTYRVTSLPAHGTLTDSNGAAITIVPYVLPGPVVTYRAASGYAGSDAFNYDVSEGPASDTGTVTITVIGGDGDGR